MFEVNMEGFDELERNLDDLQSRAEELDGENKVRLDELLNETFMANHTNYTNLDEMINGSEFEFETDEEFEEILETEEWDTFIESNSVFENWDDMIEKALAEWTAENLGI